MMNHFKNIAIYLSFISVALLAGCNFEGVFDDANTSSLTRIQITPNQVVTKGFGDLTLAVGNTQSYTANAFYADGTSKDITSSVTWASVDTRIATVTTPMSLEAPLAGNVTGVKVGQTSVTASKDGITSNTVSVTVTNTIISIQMTPDPILVAMGNTQQLTAIATYSDGTTTNITNSVFWRVDDSPVASITAAGLLTATIRPQASTGGLSYLTASKDGITSNKVYLNVTRFIITSIQITPATVSVAKGHDQKMTVIATYSNGSTADITKWVTWSTVDINKAIVTQASFWTGRFVKGVEVGSTSLTASGQGITSNTIPVIVIHDRKQIWHNQ